MIQKSQKLVITFHTTTAAMAMEQACRDAGAPGRLIPVPTSLSADCGLAWCAPTEAAQPLLTLLKKQGIPFQGMHRCLI